MRLYFCQAFFFLQKMTMSQTELRIVVHFTPWGILGLRVLAHFAPRGISGLRVLERFAPWGILA